MAGWEDVREFTLGNVSRPATRTHNRIEFGPNAIRAVQGPNDDRVLEPYAYVGANRSLYLDTGVGDEGGDQPTKSRTLEWRTDAELVMISSTSIRITVDWLDRRLSFAYALLAE